MTQSIKLNVAADAEFSIHDLRVAYHASTASLPPPLAAELDHAAGWHEQRQREWLRGRAALRALIGNAYGIEPAAISIPASAGRPRCEQRPALRLALAHSAGSVLASVGRRAHGVDLERLDRPLHRPQALAARLFATATPRLADHELLRAFVRLEALAKAQDLPLAALLGRYAPTLLLESRVAGWALVELDLPAPWYGVVCVGRGSGRPAGSLPLPTEHTAHPG